MKTDNSRVQNALLYSFIAIAISACATEQKSTEATSIFINSATEEKTKAGILEAVAGEVTIKSAQTGTWSTATANQPISPQDTIATGKGSRAKIVMDGQNEVDMSPDTNLEIQRFDINQASKKNVLLNLVYGKVRARVREKFDGGESTFKVKTRVAVSGVRGTDFLVDFDPAKERSQLVAFEGEVEYGQPGPDNSLINAVRIPAGSTSTASAAAPPSEPATLTKEELQKFDESSNFVAAAAVEMQDAQPTGPNFKTSVPPHKALRWLRNGNRRFVKHLLRADGQGRKDVSRVAKEQRPHALVWTSSDSRMSPEIIFDQKLGEIVVVRSDRFDAGVVADIEAAISQHGVRLVLVMGHSSAKVAPWLDPKATLEQLKANSELVRKWIDSGDVVFQPMIYNLNTGVAR